MALEVLKPWIASRSMAGMCLSEISSVGGGGSAGSV